jgi:hypothetical protein
MNNSGCVSIFYSKRSILYAMNFVYFTSIVFHKLQFVFILSYQRKNFVPFVITFFNYLGIRVSLLLS